MALEQNEAKEINDQFAMINQQVITTSIMISSLLDVLTQKGVITHQEMQKQIDETQQKIIEEQKKLIESQQNDSKIITPEDIRRQVKK